MSDRAQALWTLAGLLVFLGIIFSILVFIVHPILRDFAVVTEFLTSIFVGGS